MKDIQTILLLGSGALKIGEAGEFDYSGSQAIKAFKEEGKRVILVNPNIATIQTSTGLADRVYFLPVTPEFVTRIIKKEKPDGIALSFGGQTALNCGLGLAKSGVLEKFGVTVLGTPIDAINATEDRKLFAERLKKIGLPTAHGRIIHSVTDGLAYAKTIGYPVMLRAGFALGGTGSGIAHTEKELTALLDNAFATTAQVVIEECLFGWKEVEYEVVRDSADNCITVCNMENFDPVGIHTGESIVVAPSQTLTNDEYFTLRAQSIAAIREFGIIGECNIQYAIHPTSQEIRVIEVNARLSRSSALASKATGYPLAYVAARLACGRTLPEIKNNVTGKTTAFFEPALDYLVVKMPRWDLDKFTNVSHTIGSEMKSVGEVMSIGRTFEEAIQKAVRMLGNGHDGVWDERNQKSGDKKEIIQRLKTAEATRIFTVAEGLAAGLTIDEIYQETMIDRWFLLKIHTIVECARDMLTEFPHSCETYESVEITSPSLKKTRSKNSAQDRNDSILSKDTLMQAKKFGFADTQIARFFGMAQDKIRAMREKWGIFPAAKLIDTTAGEFPAVTNYVYFTYNADVSDYEPIQSDKKAIIIGGGPYAIGSSVEFDWCAVNTVKTLRENGYRAIIVNCNPETVSTDYDISDVLLFDELTLERMTDIYRLENAPFIVSVGGQIPNNLSFKLAKLNIPILGTSVDMITKAESRHEFSALLDTIGIAQPRWAEVKSPTDAKVFASEVGFPVLVRPSFVLSGRAMCVIESDELFDEFLATLDTESLEHPLTVSKFLVGAKECDVDCVADNGHIVLRAISEHVENGGVHSGDATMILPPIGLSPLIIHKLNDATDGIVKELSISGPVNIQFLIVGDIPYVIEANVRASRSFPFVSKVLGINFIAEATKILIGKPSPPISISAPSYVAVKVPQFSFHKLRGADPVLTVEMNSTGEVASFGLTHYEAYVSALLSTGYRYPMRKKVFVSLGGREGKLAFYPYVKKLFQAGYAIYATSGTALFLREVGIVTCTVGKIYEGIHPNTLDLLVHKEVDFAIVTLEHAFETKRGRLAKSYSDGYMMRRMAIDMGIPLFTNSQTAALFIESILDYSPETVGIKGYDEYVVNR